jgi:hypothetical protein
VIVVLSLLADHCVRVLGCRKTLSVRPQQGRLTQLCLIELCWVFRVAPSWWTPPLLWPFWRYLQCWRWRLGLFHDRFDGCNCQHQRGVMLFCGTHASLAVGYERRWRHLRCGFSDLQIVIRVVMTPAVMFVPYFVWVAVKKPQFASVATAAAITINLCFGIRDLVVFHLRDSFRRDTPDTQASSVVFGFTCSGARKRNKDTDNFVTVWRP